MGFFTKVPKRSSKFYTVVFTGVALVALFLVLIGCGGGSGILNLHGKSHGEGISPVLPVADSKFSIPSPIEALSHITKPRAGSAALLLRQGKDFEAGLAQHTAIEGANARFSPNWTGKTSPASTLAYAMYRFNLQGYTGNQTLQLTWATPPVDYSNLWIGFSQWGAGKWDWYPGPASDFIDLGATGFAKYTQPGTEDMLVVIIMLGTVSDVLQELRIADGLGPDIWSMFGHDSKRTRRSRARGPIGPTLHWRFRTDGVITSSPAFGPDGTVYVGSNDGFVYSLNPDCTVRWKYAAGSPVKSSPVVLFDGTVYAGCDDHNMHAIAPDGTQQWLFDTGGVVYYSPVAGFDGTNYFGSNGGSIFAVNPNGTQRWKYPTGGPVLSSAAIADDTTIYLGSNDNYLYALAYDGTMNWRYQTGGDVQSSPTIGPDGTIYVGSKDGYLYAVNPDGSGEIWRYFTSSSFGVASPALSSDGIIYIGAEDGYVYAIDSDPAISNPALRLKWRYNIGASVVSSPAIDGDGTIYVGGQDGYIYAFNPTNDIHGDLLWNYQTGGNVASSPAISANGVLFVGCNDGWLYSLGSAIECDPFCFVQAAVTTVFVGNQVQFDGSRSYEPDLGSIIKCEWDWDNNGTWDFDSGADLTVSHSYAAPGTMTCSLRVTDDEGRTATATATSVLVQLADVTGFNATDGTFLDKVVISWNPVLGATGYELKYKEANPAGNPWQSLASVVGGSTTSFEHTNTNPPGKECKPDILYSYCAIATYSSIESLHWSTDNGYYSVLYITTDKTTHLAGGSEGTAQITLVTDPDPPSSYSWTGAGNFSSTTVQNPTWKPNASTKFGKVILTVTVTGGATNDTGTIDMYVTGEDIKKSYVGRYDSGTFQVGDPPGSGIAPDTTLTACQFLQPLHLGGGVSPGSGTFHELTIGKPILFKEWELWCGPCKAEFPELDDYGQAYESYDFMFIANSSDPGAGWGINYIASWFDGNAIDYCDEYHGNIYAATWAKLGADGYIPFNVLIDRDGMVRKVGGQANGADWATCIKEICGAI